MILVLGGTHEGVQFSRLLDERAIAYKLSVATALGESLYGKIVENVQVNRFSKDTLINYLRENHVQGVVDLTHPHAYEITLNAVTACEMCSVPYFRFERKDMKVKVDEIHVQTYSGIEVLCKNLKQMVKENEKILITGVNYIESFYEHFDPSQCIFRVMPSRYSIEKCEQFSVPMASIVAVKAPCSVDFNQAIFKAYGIGHFVFKNSGVDSAYPSNLKALKGTDIWGHVLDKKPLNKETFNCLDILMERVNTLTI